MTNADPKQPDDRQARNRFFIIQITRLTGIALLFIGLLIMQGKAFSSTAEPVAGGIIIAIGMIEAVLIPQILARLWRSKS